MFVARSLSSSEQMMVFVEDPAAPLRRDQPTTTRKGKGENNGEATTEEGHTRWTYCSLGVATPAAPLATPFDAFLQRVLLGGGQAANSTNAGAWIPRSTAVSLEGFIFSMGGAGGVGDWEVKVGSVMVKGGAAGGTSRGVLVEVSSLFVVAERERDGKLTLMTYETRPLTSPSPTFPHPRPSFAIS
jgi:hypothetical protein